MCALKANEMHEIEWLLEIHPTSRIIVSKPLTTSDLSRIGRVVLPKEDALVAFGEVAASAKLQVRVRDVYQREFTFGYRVWPNNNSTMHVLEGMRPFFNAVGVQPDDTFVLAVDVNNNFQVGVIHGPYDHKQRARKKKKTGVKAYPLLLPPPVVG